MFRYGASCSAVEIYDSPKAFLIFADGESWPGTWTYLLITWAFLPKTLFKQPYIETGCIMHNIPFDTANIVHRHMLDDRQTFYHFTNGFNSAPLSKLPTLEFRIFFRLVKRNTLLFTFRGAEIHSMLEAKKLFTVLGKNCLIIHMEFFTGAKWHTKSSSTEFIA